MAYLKWGEQLPSGKRAQNWVYTSREGLVNEGTPRVMERTVVPNSEVRRWFTLKTETFKANIRKKLGIFGEECSVLLRLIKRDRSYWLSKR